MPDKETSIWTFFYGSFINLEVLKKVDVRPRTIEVARLPGFDIRIRPLANIERSDQGIVYGINAAVTHPELERLYRQDWVGSYFPEAVLTETLEAKLVPALVYIAPVGEDSDPSPDYVERILAPARDFGFPQWYLDRLASFAPKA